MKLHPFTIVSLWDMIEINVASVSNALAHLSSYWRLLEQKLDTQASVFHFSPRQFGVLSCVVEKLNDFCEKVSAPATRTNCGIILQRLEKIENNGGVVYKEDAQVLNQAIGSIMNSFPSETEEKKAFIIDNRYSDFYVGANEPLHFGEQALNAFWSIKPELSEASNCIALGRWTASVMHMMRALEVPLHTLAEKLLIDVEANPNWQNILDQIDCEARKATKAGMDAEEFQFIKESTSHLRSVKDAFRNQAMHRKTTYDEERAMAIWNGSKSFIQHLATRLSE